MITTAGIDIGSGAIKVVIFNNGDGGETEWLGKRTALIRQRDPFKLTRKTYDGLLADTGLRRDDIAYCATTGIEKCGSEPRSPITAKSRSARGPVAAAMRLTCEGDHR